MGKRCLLLAWLCAACVVEGDDGGGGGGDDDPIDPPDPGAECAPAADDCGGDEICVGDECEYAFGRTYTFVIESVALPDRKPDGDCWDSPCGIPDPFVVASSGGQLLHQTATIDDRFEAYFGEPFTVSVPRGAELTFEVYDEDLASDDGAFACVVDPLSADLLRARGMYCSGDLGEIVVSIDI